MMTGVRWSAALFVAVLPLLVRPAAGQSAGPDTLPARGDSATKGRDAAIRTQQKVHRTWFDEDRAFSLLEENDAFGGHDSDSSYTQGIRFTWDFGVRPKWAVPWFETLSQRRLLGSLAPIAPLGPCDPRQSAADRKRKPCGVVRFSIAQTQYTPPDLTVDSLVRTSRPYAGYLSASFAVSALYERAMVTTELSVGMLGPAAGARATQSLAHWTWAAGSPQPQGWQHQLRNAPQLSLRNTYTASLLQHCYKGCAGGSDEIRLFDVLPTAEVIVGSLMTRGSLGGSVRLGWRFPDLVAFERIGTTRSPTADVARVVADSSSWLNQLQAFALQHLWIVGFAGHDERYVLHNALISGSYRDGGSGGWRSQRLIDTQHDVGESYYGIAGGIGRLSLAWQHMTRTAEYSNGGSHNFGSVTLAITSPVR